MLRWLLGVVMTVVLWSGTGLAPVNAQEPAPAANDNAEDAADAEQDDTDSDDEDDEEEDEQTIEEFVEDFTAEPGLFPLYQDPETGELFMEVSEEQLGQEFIYFLYTENGAPELNHFRGAFRDNRIITLAKRFNKIEIAAENTSYHFDEDNALKRAEDANITRAPLAVAEIEATTGEDAEARYLIQADPFLTSETLHQVTPSPDPDADDPFELGDLSDDKTRITDVRNYEENTDILVEYVYDNPAPSNYGDYDITDARAVAITTQHSFIQVPENDYQPRAADFRVGYFGDRAINLTSTSYTPYQDVIQRWHLEKANPDAALSDPIEPIMFWIENTTPEEYRDIIRDAALAWNVAFEAAGFTNAIQIDVQPDNPGWDAGDIRRNVIRWTSSPNPPFGGYGPSFTNPRTGQIIGADIMLEFVYLTNRLRYSAIFEDAALPQRTDARPSFTRSPRLDPRFCQAGARLQHQAMLGKTVARAQGLGEAAATRLVEEALYELVLHEIGHTLGLMHNMRASATVPFDELHEDRPVIGSVMDYAPINLAPQGADQGAYYIHAPGPYDVWAIEFGYTPSLDDPEAEAARVEALLARSTEPALAFGNDADDMRAPGRHIDPRVMIDDLSDDPVAWARQRIALIDQTFAGLPETFEQEGESYDALRTSYLILSGQRANAAEVASRHIGGVYNNRALIGQPGAETPFVPVPYELQRAALDLLADTIFAPDAFAAGEELADRLQQKPRGFDHWGENEDPNLHARALRIQSDILDHVLHPNVLERMTDMRRYGADYAVADYLADLTATIFDADIDGEINTYRQNLQLHYIHRLVDVADPDGDYDLVAQSAARASLMGVKQAVRPPLFGGGSGSVESAAHRDHLRAVIAAFENA